MNCNDILIRIIRLGTTLPVVLLLAHACLATPQYRVLHSFTGPPDGGGVYSGVVFDANGNLYGATTGGGADDSGTVFKLKPQPDGEWSESILHSFPHGGSDGQQPSGTLIVDAAGNLYGTTELGGANQHGTAFAMTRSRSGWAFELLYSFCAEPNCTDGGSVIAGLVAGPDGNLYGATNTVFELSPGPDDWNETVLYTFCAKWGCTDGGGPMASMILNKGNLYGTTRAGGAYKVGTVFKLKHLPDGTWTERVLHSFFSFLTDGQLPGAGQLAMDEVGNLYGTTTQGGAHGCGPVGCGTVFKLTRQPSGHWKETILHNFRPGKGGYSPQAGVVFDKAGNLYGTAGSGGTECDCGVVYKMSLKPDNTWTYSVLHRFTGYDGAIPGANLILDDEGNLYGTTIAGGPGGYGVVFKIAP